MPLINRDPDEVPKVTPELMEIAHRLQMHPVIMHCLDATSDDKAPQGLSFAALSGFLPRRGDKIVLEDGSRCKVKDVVFSMVKQNDADGKASLITLTPNVLAQVVEEDDE